MSDAVLFSIGDPVPALPLPPGTPRFQAPDRLQSECLPVALDQLVERDHQVRVVWDFVEKVDLAILHAHIRAFEGRPGRPPICPRVLLALWLFATLRGVGSARRLAELCGESIPFRWLCGGISVNYHTLADFRSTSAVLFERVLINHITALRATGLVTLDHVAHDGVRERACAGTGSFRGKQSLAELRREAVDQVAALRAELDANPAAASAREKAARIRSARERQELIEEALAQLPDVEAKKKDKTKKARVSITDPDARVMKMPNGGFNPALNVQLSADTKSQIIVGVGVSTSGSDHGLLEEAIDRIEAQSGDIPKKGSFDGGFANVTSIETLSKPPYELEVYAPPTEHKDKNGNVLKPKKEPTPAVQEWHERMKTPEGQAIYKERASTIECVNALARNRGLQQFRVRGLDKVEAVVLLFAVAHNLAREASLREKAQAK